MSEPRSQSTARGANSGSAALYLRTLRATPHMSVETEQVVIEVDGGVMGAYLTRPAARGPRRAVIVAHELFALNVDIRRVVDTQIGAIRAALEAAAVRHQVSVLPGAPHAFFWGDTANLSRSLTQRRLATLERIVRRRWRRPENLIFDGHLAWPFASQPSASRLRAARDALPAPLLGARTTPPPSGIRQPMVRARWPGRSISRPRHTGFPGWRRWSSATYPALDEAAARQPAG